jgi:hemerythrin-like metal-binding protein
VSTEQSRALTYNIVDRLVQYTATHFAHEERLMRTHEYPDLALHQAEHEAMAAKAIGFRTEFKAGRAALSMDMLRELESSITGHIQSSDLQYSTFIHETAVA